MVLQVSISVYTIICSRYYPLCVLSFTLYLLLCCTVLGLALYYLAIQPLAARVFFLLLPLTHSGGGGSIVLFFGVCRLSSSVTLQCAT